MKARSRFAIITTTVAALTLSAFVASAEMKSAGGGALEFSLPGGTAGLKIEGKSDPDAKDKVTATEAGGKIVVTVLFDCGKTACIKTGIDTRDEHLRKYIGADSFSKATLSVDKSKVNIPKDGEETSGSATGEMDFHGKKNPVAFTYKAKRTGSDVHVRAQIAELKLADFGIEKPSFAGVSTGMVASIKIKFKLRGE
jgi:polyisoprenoid-binding protein YceI